MEDKREQEIKEMIKIIEEDCKKTDCKGLSDCVSCNCEALINAGYRKQSEVAKEIVARLRKMDDIIDDYRFDQLLDDIELDYGGGIMTNYNEKGQITSSAIQNINEPKAKEMFEKLGYKIAKEKLVDSCFLAYLNENSVSIGFFKDKRFVKVGDFESDSITTLEELKAINKQVEELGW